MLLLMVSQGGGEHFANWDGRDPGSELQTDVNSVVPQAPGVATLGAPPSANASTPAEVFEAEFGEEFVAEFSAGASGMSLEVGLLAPDPRIRVQAIETFGKTMSISAVTELRHALADPNPNVREAAVDKLGDIGGESAVPALSLALMDQRVTIREAAVDGLQPIRSASATHWLQQALSDTDEGVREAAREALAQRQDDR